MKCISCKGEWTPPPGITVTECPFCKAPIEPAKTPKIYDNAKDALCFIVGTYGVEALLTKSLFPDIAPMLTEERELIKMFRDKGSLKALEDALNSTASEKGVAIKRAIAKLPSYLQSSPEAISLMNDFAEALGWVVQPKIGSIMPFGRYDWRVLDVQNGRALLLTDKVIEKRTYHHVLKDVTWEKCGLRSYLNGEFYNSFGQEKSRIAETRLTNKNNPWHPNIPGGNDTNDWIFLLSLDEVCGGIPYFGDSSSGLKNQSNSIWDENNSKRIANDDSGEACRWYLRSPGTRIQGCNVAYVGDAGNVYVNGTYARLACGVRPALWVNL